MPLNLVVHSYISVADPGGLSRIRLFPSRIPDPNFFHPGARILIKEFKYFNPTKWFLNFRKYDPDPDFLPIPDPRCRGQKGTGSRIRNTAYNYGELT